MLASLENLKRIFREKFGGKSPLLASRAPGRVNLIGEHTDYNGGLVLPIAIEKSVLLIGAPNRSGIANLSRFSDG